MTHLLTLDAKRVKETEGLYKGVYCTEFYLNGKLKATVPASSKQPRKGKKTQVINCWTYLLNWI